MFSLSKHIEGVGKVLAFSEAERHPSLLSRAQTESLHRSLPAILKDAVRPVFRSLAKTTGTLGALRRVKRRFFPPKRERPLHRMEYALEQVLEASQSGPGLERCDRWVGIDNANYRTMPPDRAVHAGTTGALRVPLFVRDREGVRRYFAERHFDLMGLIFCIR